MALPANATKANLDNVLDDPKLARVELADLVDKFNDLLTHLNLSTITSGPAAIPLSIANGGTGSATAAAARTALGVEDATETQAGRIEIATQTEANNGTDDTRALTPAKLASISPASVTFAASDQILILDASDSNKLKRTTITSGKLLQQVVATSTAIVSTTTTTPLDNTKPQVTEGGQFLSATITPANASNLLLIEVSVFFSHGSGGHITGHLHQDGGANALATMTNFHSGNNIQSFQMRHRVAAGTTSATTITFRAGCNNAGTLRMNGDSSGNSLFDSSASSMMTVTEIAA